MSDRIPNDPEEVRAGLADGRLLCSGVWDPSLDGALQACDYIRVLSPSGEQTLLLGHERFAIDPVGSIRMLFDHLAGPSVRTADASDAPLQVVKMADGSSIQSAGGEYVQIVDPEFGSQDDDYEVGYWHFNEFSEDSQVVLGAFVASAAGSRVVERAPSVAP